MSDASRMDRTRVVKSTLAEQGKDDLIRDASPGELMGMVWPLTLAAWSLKDPDVAQHEFQRHVVRVVRGRG